jgi:hypothetical protein
MSDIGFAKAGETWRWRGRHASRGKPQPKRGSHAFAELEKLRRQ